MNYKEFIPALLKGRFKLSMELTEGQMIPRLFGIAYHDICSDHAIILPIPINILVGVGWRIKVWFKVGISRSKLSETINVSYMKGYVEGYERGRIVGAREERSK